MKTSPFVSAALFYALMLVVVFGAALFYIEGRTVPQLSESDNLQARYLLRNLRADSLSFLNRNPDLFEFDAKAQTITIKEGTLLHRRIQQESDRLSVQPQLSQTPLAILKQLGITPKREGASYVFNISSEAGKDFVTIPAWIFLEIVQELKNSPVYGGEDA